MKKGICIGSLPEGSYLERFKLAKEAGFDGVEPTTIETEEELEEAKKAAIETGIEIPSIMNTNHWQFPFSSNKEEDIEKAISGMRDSLKTAEFLGADTVLLVPGVVNEKISYEEAMENSVKNIKRIIPQYEEKKISIGIEEVWNKFLLSPIEFKNYIDNFDSDVVGAYFDVGNILLYGYPEQWIKTLGKRIKKIHLKDFKLENKSFVYLHQGDVNWKKVKEALDSEGYDGYLTAELPVDKDDPKGRVLQISKDIDKILEM